jgi:hypothetical protein
VFVAGLVRAVMWAQVMSDRGLWLGCRPGSKLTVDLSAWKRVEMTNTAAPGHSQAARRVAPKRRMRAVSGSAQRSSPGTCCSRRPSTRSTSATRE